MTLFASNSNLRQFGNGVQQWVRGGAISVEGIDCVDNICSAAPSRGQWVSIPHAAFGSSIYGPRGLSGAIKDTFSGGDILPGDGSLDSIFAAFGPVAAVGRGAFRTSLA